MTGQKADKLRKLSEISRRKFLTVSGATVGVVGSALLAREAFVPFVPSFTQYSGRVANVWVSNEGVDSWQNYYKKFVRLINHKDNGLDNTWMQPNQRLLLNLTLDTQNRPYPHSTDPKLLYATLRYLMEERSIPARHIFITDHTRPMILSSLGARTEALRVSGLNVGIDRAFSSKERFGMASKEGVSTIQWLGKGDVIDHVVELVSVTSGNNSRTAKEIASSSGPLPSLVIASATKVGIGESGDSQVITHQPGMLMASDHRLSLSLLSQAYLDFSFSERVAVIHMNERVVANEKRSPPLLNKGKGFVAALDKNIVKDMMNAAIVQDGRLDGLDWYSDTVDAPVGVSRLVSERYVPAVKVNEVFWG